MSIIRRDITEYGNKRTIFIRENRLIYCILRSFVILYKSLRISLRISSYEFFMYFAFQAAPINGGTMTTTTTTAATAAAVENTKKKRELSTVTMKGPYIKNLNGSNNNNTNNDINDSKSTRVDFLFPIVVFYSPLTSI